MGKFTDFIKQKLEEDAEKVSSNLIKNIIDVLKEYIETEYDDLVDDEKAQIVNNLEIAVEKHNKGVLEGPRFLATSTYDAGEGNAIPVKIVIEIVTEKLHSDIDKIEPNEDEPIEEPSTDEFSDEEESEEVPE